MPYLDLCLCCADIEPKGLMLGKERPCVLFGLSLIQIPLTFALCSHPGMLC
uniref:Uncharacterized protein n=1 Tax=Anguilla anguilla TaxID=7936 RepID=A0A0E9QJA5_ANGAN